MLLSCQAINKRTVSNVAPLCVAIATMPEIDNLPAPKMRTGQGTAHWDLLVEDDTLQMWFDQGLNMMHGFWHIEAFRAFSEVVRRDSTNAMAWWGIAMCQPGFGGDYSAPFVTAAEKAQRYKQGRSQAEQDLIAATHTLVTKGIEAAQAPFRALYKKYPDHPEIVAVSAIILRMHEVETTQQEVKKLLEDNIKKHPNHTGLLHYYVHVMETRADEYQQAIDEAEQLITLAPKAPHMVHMAGHLYYIAGDYEKALDVFHRCLDIEDAWHDGEHIPRVHNQNYIHNLHFIALCYSELGQKDKALQYARMYEHTTYRIGQPRSGGTMMLLYEGRILPALVHIRFGEYALAAERIHYWIHSLDFPMEHPVVRSYLQSMYHYAMGMDAVMRGDQEKAINYGREMTTTFQEFEQHAMQKRQDIEFKTINDTHDIISMARYELAGWIDNMDKTLPYNDAAWAEAISLQDAIKYDEPPRLMYPIEESQARLHKYRGENSMMQHAKMAALKIRPKSKMIYNKYFIQF